jgi:uncharacterized protein
LYKPVFAQIGQSAVGQLNKAYISSRVLKINVGFLLSNGPAHNHDSEFDVPRVQVSEDLTVEYIRGPIRLSRASEGILVQAKLEVGTEAECYRCLEAVTTNVTINIEELYAYGTPKVTEFHIGEDGILDLAPLVRAEMMIAATRGVLCRPDCKGLCPECGTNWNHATCTCAADAIDPRLAGLKNLLE